VTVASGALRCEGTVLSRGRTTALAEARLTDGKGRLVAHATSSCLLFETDAG
jgi:acyl-coenzyme A thioesterase PaaI-like protein